MWLCLFWCVELYFSCILNMPYNIYDEELKNPSLIISITIAPGGINLTQQASFKQNQSSLSKNQTSEAPQNKKK